MIFDIKTFLTMIIIFYAKLFNIYVSEITNLDGKIYNKILSE